MIEIVNLGKSYGKHEVLSDINLQLRSGQVHGFVGENGSGKTTLFRCIADLEGHEGSIKGHLEPMKNYTGFLPTNPYFMSRLTGREYLTLLYLARKVEVKDIDTKNIFDLPLDQYATTYSTGMKKKLALMGILLQGNQYFILDEPFSGVDIQSNIVITEIIHALKTLDKTILISSHIFSTLNDTCDNIYLLKSGKIDQIIAKQDFAKLESEMKKDMIGKKIDSLGLY